MLVRYLLIALMALGALGSVRMLYAEDAAAAPDAATEWAALVKEMESFKENIQSMKLRFSKATAAERTTIHAEANKMNKTFMTKTLVRMQELAPEILKLNPEDTVAAELTLESLYSKNQYAEVVRISDMVLKKDPKAQLAANFNGVGRYATHDFEGAVKVLKEAEENQILNPSLGGQYLDAAEKYMEYWKVEQAIRAKEDAATGDEQLPIVKLSTSKGDSEILMLENEAPNAVATFISLVDKKYYDGLKFHRVIPSFMAQGGCPNSRDNPSLAGQGGPGYNIACECYQENARRHFAGSLSMAHAGRDTGGSQFFLTHLPTDHLNPEPGKTQGSHTVFGRVIQGLDVGQALEKNDELKTAVVVRKRNHEYVPQTIPETK